MATYLDIIPEDVILVILSKIPTYVDLIPIRKVTYKMCKLFSDDGVYKQLIGIRYPQIYTFIHTVTNLGFISTYLSIYDFLTFAEIGRLDIYDDLYLENLWYSYQISIQFPKFYNQVKHINLNHNGMDAYFHSSWKSVYDKLIIHGDKSFIQGNFKQDELLAVKITNDVLFHNMCMYIYMKNGGDLKLSDIFTIFQFNIDMYDEIITIRKDDVKHLVIETGIHASVGRSNIFNMFAYQLSLL